MLGSKGEAEFGCPYLDLRFNFVTIYVTQSTITRLQIRIS